MEESYTKTESNLMHENIDAKLNTIICNLDKVETRVKQQNGKINKLTLALMFSYGILIGLVSVNLSTALSYIL
jgi:hypothetical protein